MFNECMVKDAISTMEENRDRAGEILVEKLKGRLQFLMEVPEDKGEQDFDLDMILKLLERLEVKSAFPCLLELLQVNQCCLAINPQTLIYCLLAPIPDEDAVLSLETGVLERTICQAAQKPVCLVILESFRKTGKLQEAEAFFSALVSSFDQKFDKNRI